MASLLAKKFSSYHHRQWHSTTTISPFLRLLFSTQAEQEKDIPFIARYLISSFGFSMDRALKVSAYHQLSPIKSPDRPDSVVQFFKRNGFSDAQIKNIISSQPMLLCSDVNKTLEPRARELMGAGITGEIFIELIRSNPLVLNLKNTLSKFEYWREFVGNNDEFLLKIIKRNGLLFHLKIDKVVPRINLLKEYGLSQQDITKMLVTGSRALLRQNLEVSRQFLERTEELGFVRGSGMFPVALRIVGSMKKESWDRKVEFYREEYGWSEEEVLSAFKKFPTLLGLSEKSVETKMNFLITKAGMDPKSLVSQPILLALSLEKRLVPRHLVLSILKEKGFQQNSSLCTVFCSSEKCFVEKFVEPYGDSVPELAKAYHAAYNGGKLLS